MNILTLPGAIFDWFLVLLSNGSSANAFMFGITGCENK